jgi:4-hydroxybenzoyl-CoA thioesterase
MRWIDEAAYVCGADWAGAEVITSYLAGIRFCRTVFVGDVIDVTARIIHTGPRSTHISVRVTTTNAVCGQPLLVALGVVVVVSLDDHGEARPIPQWEPGCDRDARVDQHARRLIELRQHIEPFTTAATFAIDAEAGTPAPQQGRPRVRNLGGAMTENVDVDAGSTAIV